jgi:DNA mismatch repair protein
MSKYNRGLTKEEIEKISEEVVGKTFGELGDFKYNLDDFNYKGGMGVLMEENVFQYEANSDANPDFYEAKIELKVTPVKRNKNGTYSAKERLVLNIINYMEEYKNTFETSSFWHKNENLNLMFYLWEEGVPRSDYKIIKHLLYTYPEEDLLIIKQDWEVIVNKIRNGLAHEISEADTLYLGACTKGTNKESVREQPFSEILAKQRAYCLKTSYMTNLVRTRVMDEYTESLISAEELHNKTFEESLYDKIKSFIGKSKTELIKKFGLNPKSKDVIERIFAKMLGIKGKVNDTDEFQKANITCKTIRVNEDNTITESMSFPAFKYKEIIQEEWDTSTLRNIFSENKYLFVIFKEKNNEFYFSGIKLWNMPLSILDNEVKSVWDKTVLVIKSGNIVKSVGKTRKTNFPGMKENNVAHVRPHGRNSKDVFELPVADKLTGCKFYTKYCFWLNNKYLEKILNDEL